MVEWLSRRKRKLLKHERQSALPAKNAKIDGYMKNGVPKSAVFSFQVTQVLLPHDPGQRYAIQIFPRCADAGAAPIRLGILRNILKTFAPLCRDFKMTRRRGGNDVTLSAEERGDRCVKF